MVTRAVDFAKLYRVCESNKGYSHGNTVQHLAMADRPPTGYLEILEAERKCDQPYNVIGICTDYLEPAMSRGTDLTMKIQLWDASCNQSPDLGVDGMQVRCFYKDRASFPLIQNVGDIVIARNLKTLLRGSQRFGITNHGTTWTVIPGSSLFDNNDPEFLGLEVRNSPAQKTPPSIAEFQYAKSLAESKDPSTLRGPPKSTALDVATIMTESGGMPPPARKKYRMIKEIISPFKTSAPQFIDLIGEVRRVYGGSGNPVEIQLTDYTEHPLLFNYAEPEGATMQQSSWVGPWGKMTMTVNAWDQLGTYVVEKVRSNEIDLGTYVRLCNVQIKMDRQASMMQGNLRGGSSNSGTSITIHSAKDAEHIPELKDLITRKRAYNVDRKSKAIGFAQQEVSSNKRPREEEHEEKDNQQKRKEKKSKSARNKEKRLMKNTAVSNPKAQSNQYVRCEAINIPLTTITSILEGEFLDRVTAAGNPYRLPFNNCKYKSKVQVIDFFPDNLEDFATPYRVSDYEALSDYESADDEEATLDYAKHKPDDVKWKWHFFLMVIDPTILKKSKGESEVMLLQVAGQDGDYLLNLEACDLREHPDKLAKLREKLFVLWGELEEKKAASKKTGLELMVDEDALVSSRPFECLIKEYGVSAAAETSGDWQRMFRIHGTNIG